MIFQEKIKLALETSNLDEFNLKEVLISGDNCILITPKEMGVEWNINNLVLRSCIFKKNDFSPVSLSFLKFLNFGEKPTLYPNPLDYKDWIIDQKEDGSTICISKYKGNLVCRTRGVDDAFIHDTGEELKELLQKNPFITDNQFVNSEQYTLLFEHLSIVRSIILKPEKAELVLIGAVKHEDYLMVESETLDFWAKIIQVRRPTKFTFNSIDEILKTCETLKGIEGYVLNYDNNQNRVKLKAHAYLILHRMKSELSSFDKILDLFILLKRPDFKTFYDYLEKTFDIELTRQVEPDLLKICKLDFAAKNVLVEIEEFSNNLAGLNRKEAALKILDKYRPQQLDSFAFTIYSKKLVDDKVYKKLIYNLIENEKS